MTDRWRRITEVFDAALALPGAEREALVRRELAGDDDAILEVSSLLAHHERAEGFLSASRAGDAIGRVLLPVAIGESVGAWRVQEPIGEGGMGVVYRAERASGGFTQTGALKLIRTGLPSSELLRRFARERQILASLDHPNIARLLDGGSTPEGLPWLVMEYVEGRPLYEHCSERALSLENRLTLFLSVCSAVQYAHQRLVMHRDLKPGNLLVTAGGEPKLLDFGIARVLAEDAAGAAVTRTLQTPMTPEYASPEQLRGEPVSTASDVYSLGVVLYELVTGVRPYPATAAASELLARVTERDPERPSTVVTRPGPASQQTTGGRRRLPAPPAGATATLRRRLSGDLDNIVLKAMHKDPARRYSSADQLAADLRRFLGGYPVHARPDTWSYRTSRFVRRNQVAVVAGAIALLALFAGLAGSLWQASVAKQQRAIAERRYELVHHLANTLIFDVNDAVAGLPGGAPVRELVLTRAVGYLDSLSRDAAADTTLALDLADAYERVAIVQGVGQQPNVGKPISARENFAKCIGLREGLREKMPGSRRLLLGLVTVYTKLASFEQNSNHNDVALVFHRKALAAAEQLAVAFPEDRDYRANLFVRRYNLGNIAYMKSRSADGLRTMEQARHDLEALLLPDTMAARKRLLARVEWSYAQGLMTVSGRTDSALAALDRSESLYVSLQRRTPHDRDLELRRAINLGLLAMISLYRQHQPERALRYASASSAIVDTLSSADAGNKDMELNRAIARFLVGYMAAVAGHLDEAGPILRESRTRWSAMATVPDLRPTALAELESSDEADSWIAEHQARGAELHGRPSREHWRTARRALGKAYAVFDSLNTGGEPGTLTDEQRAIMLVRMAHMDSVLAGRR